MINDIVENLRTSDHYSLLADHQACLYFNLWSAELRIKQKYSIEKAGSTNLWLAPSSKSATYIYSKCRL